MTARCAYPLLLRLLHQQLADRLQFSPAFRGGRGTCHLQVIESIQDNLGDDQTRIFLIIGRNDVPMRVMGAGRFQARLISVHVILPVFALVNVRGAEFPVVLRFINALKEALSLFVLRKVEKNLMIRVPLR